MKFWNPPTRSVARKLWLGFGLLMCMLVLTAFVSYWQLGRISGNVTDVVEVQEPLGQSILEMENSVQDATQAVLNYVRNGNPANIEKLRAAETEFHRVSANYSALAKTEESIRLGQEVAQLYGTLSDAGLEIVSLANDQNTALESFREDVKEVGEQIDAMLQAALEESSPDSKKKLEAAVEMKDTLSKASAEVGVYVTEPRVGQPLDIQNLRSDLGSAMARYRGTSLSVYEEQWISLVDGDLEETVSDGVEVVSITDALSGLVVQFERTHGEIGAVIRDQVQPYIHDQITSASESAKSSTTTALRVLLSLSIVGVLIGGVSALIISRKITSPIQELMEGARTVGSGRLDYRFPIDAEGELGRLSFALNRMLENLARSREALGESEETAWALLDAASDPVMLVNTRGFILASNDAAAQRFGMSLEQMIDECVYDLLPPDLAVSRKQKIEEVIRTRRPVHFEDEREGMLLEQKIYPVFDAKGEVSRLAIFTSDITMHRWVEEVTDQLARRHQLILEAAGEGIYGVDTQGRTTFVNPAGAQMLGYEPGDLVGRNHHELVHHTKPDGSRYPQEECPIYAAFRDGIVHHGVEEVFWRRDGTSFAVEYTSTPILQEGAIMGAVVTYRDISERTRVENALRDSEEKYRSMFESAANVILSVDEEGVVIDCNAQVEQLLGYPVDEVTGRSLIDIVHPDESANLRKSLEEVLTKGYKYNTQYKLVRKDGTHSDVIISAAAVRDASGEYVRTICMIGHVAGQSGK